MPAIYRTNGTPTSDQKGTLSFWIKGNNPSLATDAYIFDYRTDSNNWGKIALNASQTIEFANYDSSSLNINLWAGPRVFRDPSAWWNLVIAIDTTQSVSTDRIKIYVNGVQETSLNNVVYPSVDYQLTNFLMSGSRLSVGSHWDGSSYGNDFNGCLSWVQFVDGLQLAPTEFGEVDATSGIWKIKTTPYATPGNNGFCLKMEDRTNLDLDSSSNAHTMTTSGTLVATYDTPSNNFATLNPLMNVAGNGTLSEGNNTWTRSGNWVSIPASLGMIGGKWYWEVRGTSSSGDVAQATGIANGPTTLTQTIVDWNATNVHLGDSTQPDSYAHWSTGTLTRKYNNNTNSTWGTGTGAGPVVIQVAFDADNGTIWVGKDGTWMNSATQGEIEAGTTTNAMYSGITVDSSNPYFPAVSCENNAAAFNFGNGYFGTTAVSTPNSDTAGIGAMEYEVPDGYYCLCTKNIKAYGG